MIYMLWIRSTSSSLCFRSDLNRDLYALDQTYITIYMLYSRSDLHPDLYDLSIDLTH